MLRRSIYTHSGLEITRPIDIVGSKVAFGRRNITNSGLANSSKGQIINLNEFNRKGIGVRSLTVELTFSTKTKHPKRKPSSRKTSPHTPSTIASPLIGSEPTVRFWRQESDLNQLTYHAEAIGQSLAMTLLLGPKYQKKVAEKGIPWLQQRIADELRKAGHKKSHVIIVGGYGTKQLIHAHGFVSGTHNSIPHLIPIFQKACGPWAKRRGKDRQIDLQPVEDIQGWLDYCRRNESRFRKHLPGVKSIAVSRALKAQGRRLWEDRHLAAHFPIV